MDFQIDRSAQFTIGRTNHVLQSEIRAELAKANSPLSAEGASILLLLISINKPIRVSELAKLAVRDGTTLKRQIDGLVKLDFVVQNKDESDGRVVLISHTEQGFQEIEKLSPVLNAITERAMAGIESQNIEIMTNVLNRMRSNLRTE